MIEIPQHQPCFGRDALLDQLESRVARPGVTFITAPPRMGKTWVVRNLAFARLMRRSWNIGYIQSSGGRNDLLRAVLMDLYRRWLATASMRAQARSLWHRHKENLTGQVGPVIGKLLGKLASMPPGNPVSDLIESHFDALSRANRSLATAGLSLSPITYDDARELVKVISLITDRPTILLLDAWEQGINLAADKGAIRAYLDNVDDWTPSFHIVITIRDLPHHDEDVQFAVECAETYAAAEIVSIAELQLDNPNEQDRLMYFLRSSLPIVNQAPVNWVLEQCRNPAVIEWWLRHKPSSRDLLYRYAGQAQSKQYLGLLKLIEQEVDNSAAFRTIARLAMLPEIDSSDTWATYRPLLDDMREASIVVDLQSRRILELGESEYPSFGHTTAYDAVRERLLSAPASQTSRDLRPFVRQVVMEMMNTLCQHITIVGRNTEPYIRALAHVGASTEALRLDASWAWPGRLARAMLGELLTDAEIEGLLESVPHLNATLPSSSFLLSCVLVNCTTEPLHINVEDRILYVLGNSLQMDGLSEALTANQAIALFNGIVHALNSACIARAGDLMSALATLSQQSAIDSIHDWYAKALYNMANNDRPHRDEWLSALDVLVENRKGDGPVRSLARALFNARKDASEERDVKRRDELMNGLRNLCSAYAQNGDVLKSFAMALADEVMIAGEERAVARRDDLLAELRAVECSQNGNSAVTIQLLRALVNMLNYLAAEKNYAVRDEVLFEIQRLAYKKAHVAAIRELLSMAIVNAIDQTADEGDLARCDKLLSELRHLTDYFQTDGRLGFALSRGLAKRLYMQVDAGDWQECRKLLSELQSIALEFKDEVDIVELYSQVLRRVMYSIGDDIDLVLVETVYREIRRLSAAYPENRAVNRNYAGAVFRAHRLGCLQNIGVDREGLLEELRRLAGLWKDDRVVCRELGRGLSNMIAFVVSGEHRSRQESLVSELRELCRERRETENLDDVLARSLYNWLLSVKEGTGPEDWPSVIWEIGELWKRDPQSDELRRSLAKSLAEGIELASRAEHARLVVEFMEQLSELRRCYSIDVCVQDCWVRGIAKCISHAREVDDGRAGDRFDQELHDVVTGDDLNGPARGRCMQLLVGMLGGERTRLKSARATELADDLRNGFRRCPENAKVREWYVKGVVESIMQARIEKDIPKQEAFLVELRITGASYREDACVQEQLMHGLLQALATAIEGLRYGEMEGLLGEMRSVWRGARGEMELRSLLAAGLCAAIGAARDQKAREECLARLAELREIMACKSTSEELNWTFAKALVAASICLTASGDEDGANGIAEELVHFLDANQGEEKLDELWAQLERASEERGGQERNNKIC
jgi:hypothetical protein